MTLQEYLIKLGWNIDEPSFKKFVSAVSQTGAVTAEVGSIALETATAVEFMVSRVAAQYENLYWISRRTGQSVPHLQAMRYAFSQIGLSAEDATDAIEGMATTLRNQPWLAAISQGARTPTELVKKLSKSGLPYFLQAQFASMLGVPEKTYFQVLQNLPDEAKFETDRNRRLEQAFGPEAAQRIADMADRGHRFNVVLRQVEDELGVIGDQIYDNLVDPMTKATEAVEQLLERFAGFNKDTGGSVGTTGALIGTAAGGLLLTRSLRFIGRLLFGRSATAKELAQIKNMLASGSEATAAEAATAGESAAVEVATGVGVGTLGLVGVATAGILALTTKSANANESGPWNQPLGGPDSGKSSTPSSDKVTDRLNQAIKFFIGQGYSKEAATGIASALFFESGKTLSPTANNPKGGGRGAWGIGQWRAERLDAFKKMFGKDVQDASFEEQLKFVAWELSQGTDKGALNAGNLLRKGNLTAGQSGKMFIEMFERPRDGGQEAKNVSSFADRLSALAGQQNGGGTTTNINVNSKTEINASGSNAADVANRVAGAQDTVTQNTARAVQAATR